MATAKGDVDIAVKLRGAREFVRETAQVSKSVKGMSDTYVDSNGRLRKANGQFAKATDDMGGSTRRLGAALNTLGPIAAAAGGALLTFGAFQAKKAVDTTVELGKSTMRLNRMTAMGIEQSSMFAAVSKVRGIEDKKMGMSLTRLSRAMVDYQKGTDTAREALDFFGVSQDAIRRGDFQAVLVDIANGYSTSTDAARKNIYMQQLLGRTWQDLAPLFAQGGKGLREELNLAGDLGAIFNDLDIKNVGDIIAAQRRAQYATLGLQVSLGKKLIPLLAKASIEVTRFLTNWSKGIGTAGDIKRVFQDVGPVIGTTVSFLWRAGSALARIWQQSRVVRQAIKQAFQTSPIASAISVVANLAGVFRGLRKGVAAVKSAFVSAWDAIKNGFRSAINFVIRGWNSLQFRIPAIDLPGPGKFGGTNIGVPRIPELADGGRIRRSGIAWVGERGPELLRLPTGAQVEPLTGNTGLKRLQVEPLPAGPGFGGTVVTKVYLDRRQIAEAVGSEFAGRQARR